MKKILLFIAVLFIGFQSEACRFTIREIGYSNLLLEKYELVLHADSLKHKKLIDEFKSIAFAYSIDANVEYSVKSDEVTAPKIRFLSGEGLLLHTNEVKNSDDILNAVTQCLTSSLRKQLINGIGNSFAAILYFEGNTSTSGVIDKRIQEAILKFRKVSPHLDKAVSEDIQLLKILYTKREKEAVVLKALGIPENNGEPIVALIYGRGRLAGKPLLETEITAQNIFNGLVLLGTDCECGIDLSPLLENALPMNWPVKLRQKTAEMLEFDADNPMILAEMSRILAKGAANNQGDITPFTPKTFELKKETDEIESNERETEPTRTFSFTLIIIAILSALILLTGLFKYFRKN
jgi:hypothetical protein